MIEDLRIFILKKTEYEWKEQFKGTTPEKALDEICEFILDEEEEWSWPPSMRRDAALVEKLYGKLLNLRRINGAPAFRISSHMKYHIIASDIDLGNKMVDELYLGGYIFVKFLGLGGYGLVCQFEDGNEQHNLDQQMLQDLRYAAHGQVPEPIERKDLQHSNYAIKSIYKRKARESTIKKMTNNIKFIEENITNCGNDAYFILTNQMIEINDNYYIISEPLTSDLWSVLYTNIMDVIGVREQILCKIIYGIKCLHEIGIIHGDIKEENIFVKLDELLVDELLVDELLAKQAGLSHELLQLQPSPLVQIKIADFDGSGRVSSDGQLLHEVTLYTTEYISYKIRDSSDLRRCDDIFALGFVITSLFSIGTARQLLNDNAKRKMSGGGSYQQYDTIFTIQERLDICTTIPEEFKEIIKSMLNDNPNERITANELYERTTEYCKKVSDIYR